jgi:hypothetical protein
MIIHETGGRYGNSLDEVVKIMLLFPPEIVPSTGALGIPENTSRVINPPVTPQRYPYGL